MKDNSQNTQEPVVIARRILFSTAHFYEQKRFSAEQNKAVFGACFTPHGHGHNYTLETFLEGPIDPETGLVINVTELDQIMKSVTSRFDHHHINFDVPEFKDVVPTTENLSAFIFSKLSEELARLHPKLKLNRIRLFETDDLWTEVRSQPKTKVRRSPAPTFRLTRQVEIRSIHHLENPFWSDDENRKMYGICFGRHGHHYKVQVTCSDSIDETSGLMINRHDLDEILEREVVAPFDGFDLNGIFVNTSCEAIAQEIFKRLEPHLKETLVRVGIQETRKNYFEFPPG